MDKLYAEFDESDKLHAEFDELDKLYAEFDELDELLCNKTLVYVSLNAWEAKWDIEFNPSKYQVIRVTSSRTPLQTQYILHGQVLEVVSSARYLVLISPAI